MRSLGFWIFRFKMMREYGWKYHFDEAYRNDIRRKRKNRKDTLRSRKKYGASWNRQVAERKQKLYRRNNKCFWCKNIMSYKNATVDHIIPAKYGRNNKMKNLRLIHDTCRVERDRLINKKILSPDDNTNRFSTINKPYL